MGKKKWTASGRASKAQAFKKILMLGDKMTVAELIVFLKAQPQNLQVAYRCYSEQVLLQTDEIEIKQLLAPREDGWIHNYRDDKPTHTYLLFPGN